VPGRPERDCGFNAHPNERDDLKPDNPARDTREWRCRGSHKVLSMILDHSTRQ
jgi:hypothetical protein